MCLYCLVLDLKGIRELIDGLQARGKAVYLITGGFRCAICYRHSVHRQRNYLLFF